MATLLSSALVLALVVISHRHVANQKKMHHLELVWRAWLTIGLYQHQPAPAMPKGAYLRAGYAHMWREALVSTDGQLRARLVRRAKACGLDSYVVRILYSGRLAHPMAVEICLALSGLMGLKALAPRVLRFVRPTNGPLTFAAALALLRLYPNCFEQLLARMHIERWSTASLLALFKEAGPERADPYIERLLPTVHPRFAARLLSAWSQLSSMRSREVARVLLRDPATEGWLLCAALRLQRDPRDLPGVVPHLRHARWAVRLQAVKAYARLAGKEELERLREFENDENWWIRLRVSEALCRTDTGAVR